MVAVTKQKQTEIAQEFHDINQLHRHDLVYFDVLPQPELSNQICRVSEINTYDHDGVITTCFTIVPTNGPTDDVIHMSVIGDRSDAYLCFAKRLKPEEVNELFDSEELDYIIESENDVILERLTNVTSLAQWTAPSYALLEESSRTFFHKGDYRKRQVPDVDYSTGFDYYLLEDSQNAHAIEIEHYNHQDPTLYAVVYHSLSTILKMTTDRR